VTQPNRRRSRTAASLGPKSVLEVETNVERFIYKGEKTRAISFPLGGIGTGSIGLAGNGRLVDWEIFNRPNKGSLNGFSHFAIKAETSGRVLDARVLNGDLPPHYTGAFEGTPWTGFGFGPPRGTMAGVPHFADLEFCGEFPFAELRFIDESFPGSVSMTAFNPFIPLNDRDSSIPGAFFEVRVDNTMSEPITYTVCASVTNPLRVGGVNKYILKDGLHAIQLLTVGIDDGGPEYGDLTVATDCGDISYQEYWYRGAWFDNLGIYWRQFTSPGKLENRTYPESKDNRRQDVCSLAAHIRLGAGESGKVRFVLTWNFPNAYNYWNPEKCGCSRGECKPEKSRTWKNYYATVFKDSLDSACYSLRHWNRLYEETNLFKQALFSSTIPRACLDAVSANISILKTPTCLRLEDGSFYGFEGCNCDSGCCEGSCTHVWNYAYALPFLFPRLERSMRDLDFRYNQAEDGAMAFRLQLPLGRGRWGHRPCADGQFGGVIKTYRDWKISGDTQWLRKNWQSIKRSIEHAWAETNRDRWDADKDGVLEGWQHHTLDMELYGPNSWLNGFYLAALKAGAEMADYLGEKETAAEYLALFERGKQWTDQHLFNGEYYFQKIDLKDKSPIDRFTTQADSFEERYWNEESKEIKYQIGEGCGVDQVLAQWHANLCGLGEVFDKAQTRKALQSIYRYNFKQSMRKHFNPCRIYALNDEAGVVICEWPEGKYKPIVPVPYSEEAWPGCEYQVASHMIQEGLVDEGLRIVEAVRDRFDGEKRNPWNEFECGSNYARSMSSYSLLNSLSGFEFDMVAGMIGFNPVRIDGDAFRCFWSLDSGWGVFEVEPARVAIRVEYGRLDLKTVRLPFLQGNNLKAVCVDRQPLDYARDGADVTLGQPVRVRAGSSLVVEL
jgi:non-lysosomal glucosylceramidase